MRSEPKREKDKANSEELEGERESSQQSGYTMFFWLHCLSRMDILPFYIYNLKKEAGLAWHNILQHSKAGLFRSLLLFFFFASLCNVCFKQWWHITADKWDIFFSAHGALILHIYGTHACLHTHAWMQEEPRGLAWRLEWRAGKKIKGDGGIEYGSYIFRSSSRGCIKGAYGQSPLFKY